MAAPSPVDWDRAERVAVRIATRHATPAGHDPTWVPPIDRIEEQIEEVTGLRSTAGPARLQLIDRPEWVRANIQSFRRLLAPLLDKVAERAASGGAGVGPLGSMSRNVAGVEIGALLGWMSTRVLGQYDLLVGRDHGDDAVYLIEPNLASVERRFGFDTHQFRSWVLLHELTHRAQFTGVPWMRDHFTALVEQSLSFADPDPHAVLHALRESLRNRRDAGRHLREHGVVGLIAGPEQRAVIARIGGLMSLLEGHGDVTMTRAAGDLVPAAERFARVLAERRRRIPPLTRVLLRLTGLEGKLNQYAAGEGFIAAVEAQGGPRAIDTCWERPDHLPSLDEVRQPALWLRRMGELVA